MSQDVIDEILTRIIFKVSTLNIPVEQRSKILERISSGMHQLLWPVLIAHIPSDRLEVLKNQTTPMTIDQYSSLIEDILKDHTTGQDIFDELYGALQEIEAAVNTYITSN